MNETKRARKEGKRGRLGKPTHFASTPHINWLETLAGKCPGSYLADVP